MKIRLLMLIILLNAAASLAQLNGSYTIGGTTPDYMTITDAVTALSTSGISGAVTFNIRNGIYSEKIMIPSISGTTASNTITFQSQSGDSSQVVLTDSSSSSATNNFTLQLNGADYFTFKNITVRRTGTTTYGSVIAITNASNYNNFLHNLIQGTAATTLTTNSSLVYSAAGTASNDSSNTFSFNLFENGSYGLYFFGASATVLESGTVITENIFKNTYGRAIQLANQNAPNISGNVITTTTSYATFYCMYFSACKNDMIVERNKMTAPNGGYGMYFTATNGTGLLSVKIINNFIHVGGTATAYGIYITGSSFINFWYNSVNVTGSGGTSNCIYITSATTTKLISQNNVFVNSGGGVTYYITNTALTALSVSNYNDIYSTGTNLAYWDTGMQTSLVDWRSASGRDGLSVSTDPVFASGSDLHAFGGGITNIGIPIAGITTDIDGEIRSTINPDLGADEFIPLSDNLVVTSFISPATIASCGDTATTISISIGNIGSLPQSNIPLQVEISGPISITLYDTIVGPIQPNTVYQNVFSQTINTTGGGQYNFKAFSSQSNDQYRNNDTINAARVFYTIPNSPQAGSPQQVCDNNATIIATADSGNSLFWFDQPVGGNLLHIGNPFITSLTSDSTFYVEAREGTGSSGCLRITECEIGSSDFIEIQNLSGASFDATGWVVSVSNSYTNINLISPNTWQLGLFNAGEIQTRSDVTGSQYWGSNILWNPGSNSWVVLIDPNGVVKDFIAWGWSDIDIQNMNIVINGFTITVGQEWTGPGFTACGTGSISRIGNSDNNSAADFACENNTIGLQNINLSPSFANCGLGLCSSLRIPVDVVILPGVSVNLGNDTSIAIPFSYTLDAGTGFTNYLWSDNSTGQTLTATQSGTYWVTVTGGNGCSFTDSININVSVGISQTFNQDLITIYPNPVNKILHVELADGLHADFLNIIDLNGHIILEQKINNQLGLNTFSVDVHDYIPGIYFLRIVGKENTIIEKLFIQPN